MNYYPHHIGDYASATAHLTPLEDCFYRRLLDWYYLDEKPIPLEPRAVYRRIRAAAEADREAVDTVLGEFFIRTDEGYRHGRCDAEIERSRIKSEARREAGSKAWRGKAAIAPEKQAIAQSADANAEHTQEPITNNQKPIAKGGEPPNPPAALPAGFVSFWDSYPNTGRRVQKADCLAVWRRDRLEAKADEIVAHVDAMTKSAQWVDGFEPKTLTYLRGKRYDDPIPDSAPRQQSPPTQGKYSATIAGLTGRTRQPETIDVTEHFPRRLVSPPV